MRRRRCPMKTFIILAAVCLSPLLALAQGDLAPPPGPPVPTMKTLDQIEPRTPLAGSTSTVTITTAGSYFLTGDVAVTAGNGIVISADNVTLDLHGFTVSSSGAFASNSTGISLVGNLTGVHIRNGHVRGTLTYNG